MKTITQLSTILNIPQRTLRDWCMKGRVKAQKAGRTWIVEDRDFYRLVNKKGGII